MADGPDDDLVTEDVGGVQGSEPDAAGPDAGSPAPRIANATPDQPAPDAGEIEWAGALVKKPPAAAN